MATDKTGHQSTDFICLWGGEHFVGMGSSSLHFVWPWDNGELWNLILASVPALGAGRLWASVSPYAEYRLEAYLVSFQ